MGKKSRRKSRRQGVSKNIGPGQSVSRSNALINRILLYLRRHWAVVKSVLIFIGCILLFMLIYSRIADGEQLASFRAFIAGATGAILKLLSFNIQVIGTMVSSPEFSMGIIAACTGIVSMAIFTSAVVAYPCRFSRKVEGIVLGIASLFVFNLIRMVGLFIVGSYLPDFFNSAHYIIGQSLMILLALGLWLFWLEKRAHVTSR